MCYDYESQSQDELELCENDRLLVLESADEEAEDGFCFGRVLQVAPGSGALSVARVGRTGFFPSVMVEPLTPQEVQELAGFLSASSASGPSARSAGGLKGTLTKWVEELRRAKLSGGKDEASQLNGMYCKMFV